MSFWKELSRRNVVKVGVAYAVAAWLIIHPVDIVFPILHLPEWSITLVTAFLIICFPFVLIFSWVYEVTPKGLKKTKEVPVSKSTTHVTGRKLNYIIIGLLVLTVVLLIFDNFYLDRRTVETKEAPALSDVVKTKKTIAVLPFENLSSDPEQAYFVDGLSEEILNSLCQIPGLGVTGRTSSFSFKGTNKTIQEIASVLGVDNILEGSVRKSGNSLRITAQLVRAVDDLHLWSKTYDHELKDIFTVQKDIANAVASELKVTLGISKSFRPLGSTNNVEAYQHYLVARGLIGQGSANNLKGALLEQESIDKAIALDPKFALAWVYKARIHGYWAVVRPANQAAEEINIAKSAVLKAIELEPNLNAGCYWLGAFKSDSGDLIGAELAFRKALELTTEPFWESSITIVPHYWFVAEFKKAYEIIEGSRISDPLNEDNRDAYITSLALIGDIQQAEEEYRRVRGLVGENQWDAMTITDVRLGTKDTLSRDDIIYSDPIYDAAKEHIDSPEKALSELHRLYADKEITRFNMRSISRWAAYFGDPELAMDAIEKGATDLFYIWYPVMSDVRHAPRFKKYVKKIGLVDYWNKFGWPDICHKLDNGDFECD